MYRAPFGTQCLLFWNADRRKNSGNFSAVQGLPRYTKDLVVETLPLHHLARVVSLLSHGHCVGYPTGTSYGLGVNALDEQAIRRLSELKQRPTDKTYTVLLPTSDPERFVAWTDLERKVFRALQDRPLTLLVEAKSPLARLAQDGRIGIRTPDHPFTRALTEMLPFPITATSANVSSQTAACAPNELEQLASGVRLYVIEGGRLPRCVPSTVAAWNGTTWEIVRPGDVTERELRNAALES